MANQLDPQAHLKGRDWFPVPPPLSHSGRDERGTSGEEEMAKDDIPGHGIFMAQLFAGKALLSQPRTFDGM